MVFVAFSHKISQINTISELLAKRKAVNFEPVKATNRLLDING